MDDLDYTVTNHGSIVLIAPHSQAADEWLDENIGDDAMWFGGALAVEPRYVGDILYGMQEAGLTSNVTVEPA